MFPLRFIIFLLRFLIFLFYFPILIPSVIFISTMFKLVQYSPQVFSSELLHSIAKVSILISILIGWISSETIFHFFFHEKGPQIIRVSEFFFLPPSLKFFFVVVLQVQLFNHGRLWCPSALSGFLEHGISCQSVLFLFL